MSVEAYNVGFEKVNYHAPIPEMFDPEVVYGLREKAIKDNLLSYAGEYRLGVKFDEYYYKEEQDKLTGERYLTSHEPGPIRNIYKRAIANREKQGLSAHREVAECLGFEKFERGLIDAPDGTMALWLSPPGKKSDGYERYSFLFVAQVVEDIDGKKIRMIPCRNERSLSEYNNRISKVTGEKVEFKTDVEALSTPYFIFPRESVQNAEDVLIIIGEDEKLDVRWKKELEKSAQPFLQAFLYLVRTNAPDEELLKVKDAYENFVIAFKDDRSIRPVELKPEFEITINNNFGYRYRHEIEEWGSIEPPKVGGSCGFSGDTSKDGSSSTLPMEFQKLSSGLPKDKYGERTFNCPSCKKENLRPYNTLLPKCLHCKSDKVAC